MARGANPGASQTPETIDDAPPPFESPLDDNQPETYDSETPKKKVETAPQGSMPAAPPPAAFHPQTSQPSQFPPQNTQMRSVAGQPQSFPPPAHQDQPQSFPPQAFPPPQHDQTQAFPPPQGGQPHSFSPSELDKTQAFPPPQGSQPHAFPPSDKTQAFPPRQDFHQPPPAAFPPQSPPHAFPPQSGVHNFPPQNPAFQPQNMPQFQQARPNFGNNPGFAPSPMNQPMPNPGFVQPTMLPQGFPVAPPAPTNPWQAEFFGCMDDPTNALITACFPCVTFGQIAEIIDNGQTSCATSGLLYGCIAFFIGMPCLISCTYRSKLRARYGLMESPAPDWLIHCLCEPCALCQEYRELQRRGIDPSIGWQGNLARAQQKVQLGNLTPPPHQNMMA